MPTNRQAAYDKKLQRLIDGVGQLQANEIKRVIAMLNEARKTIGSENRVNRMAGALSASVEGTPSIGRSGHSNSVTGRP